MTEVAQPGLIEALGARGVVQQWTHGAGLLALVGSVHSMGWLEKLREPTPAQALVTPTWTAARVQGVLTVLTEAGVLAEESGDYRLTPGFLALVNGASGVSLEAVLDAAHLELDELAHLGDEPEADPQAALVVAQSSGVRADPVTQALYRSVYEEIPEAAEAFAGPGPMLDLGCGVGGALLTTAQLYPQLKLVGVDIAPAVVAEAQQRRDALGLTDRVEVRQSDARDLTEEGAYPIAYWAQSFFPDDARADTLKTLRRALTEDGLLVLQEFPVTPTASLVQARHGITANRTAADLAQEAQDAGFELVRLITTNLGNLALMRNQR